jgi:AraC-like DNA-binding protein
MTRGGSISVPSIRGYLELARARGLDVDAILREVGNPDLLADFDGRVGFRDCEKIATAIADRIGLANMVRTMLSFRGTGFGVLYYVVRNSTTVGVALRRLVDHYHVTSTLARAELVEAPDAARLNLLQHSYLSGPFRQIISAFWTISNVTVLGQLLGDGVAPARVGLELPRPVLDEDFQVFENALRCQIDFASRISTIAIEPSLLARNIIDRDPAVEAAMLSHVEEVGGPLSADDTADRVRRHFMSGLRTGEPTIETVARHLRTTSRTLQRRLSNEGTSFTQVLDEARREMALSHMRGRRATIDEVAFLLGFEKPTSFHRAFKRWTGVTPGEFRRQSMPTH